MIDTTRPSWVTTGVLEKLLAINEPDSAGLDTYFYGLNDRVQVDYRDQNVYGIPAGDGRACSQTFQEFYREPGQYLTPIEAIAPLDVTYISNPFTEPQGFNACLPKTCHMCWWYDDIHDENTQLPRLLNPVPEHITCDIKLPDGDLGTMTTVKVKLDGCDVSIVGEYPAYDINGNRRGTTHFKKHVMNYTYSQGEPLHDREYYITQELDENGSPQHANVLFGYVLKPMKASEFNGTYILTYSGYNPELSIGRPDACNFYHISSGISDYHGSYKITAVASYGKFGWHNIINTDLPCNTQRQGGYLVTSEIRIECSGGELGTASDSQRFVKLIPLDYPNYPNSVLENSTITNSISITTDIIPDCSKIKELTLEPEPPGAGCTDYILNIGNTDFNISEGPDEDNSGPITSFPTLNYFGCCLPCNNNTYASYLGKWDLNFFREETLTVLYGAYRYSDYGSLCIALPTNVRSHGAECQYIDIIPTPEDYEGTAVYTCIFGTDDDPNIGGDAVIHYFASAVKLNDISIGGEGINLNRGIRDEYLTINDYGNVVVSSSTDDQNCLFDIYKNTDLCQLYHITSQTFTKTCYTEQTYGWDRCNPDIWHNFQWDDSDEGSATFVGWQYERSIGGFSEPHDLIVEYLGDENRFSHRLAERLEQLNRVYYNDYVWEEIIGHDSMQDWQMSIGEHSIHRAHRFATVLPTQETELFLFIKDYYPAFGRYTEASCKLSFEYPELINLQVMETGWT